MDVAAGLVELEAKLGEVSCRERVRLIKDLAKARQRLDKGQPIDRMLGQIAKRAQQAHEAWQKRKQLVPKVTYPEGLPVVEQRDEVAKAIADHQVVVVCGRRYAWSLAEVCRG